MEESIALQSHVFRRVLSLSPLHLWLRPVELAACACVDRSVAALLSNGRQWQQLHARLWPSCTDACRSVSEWRTLAIQRDVLDTESAGSFTDAARAALAAHADDETKFTAVFLSGALARNTYRQFARSFNVAALPVTLRLVSLKFFDGGRGGISGACSVELMCVVAVYFPHSAAPLYLSHSYFASGYNDDPTVSGKLVCLTSRVAALKHTRKLVRGNDAANDQYRSTWLKRAESATADPHFRSGRLSADGGGDNALIESFAVARGRTVLDIAVSESYEKRTNSVVGRAMADLIALIPPDLQEVTIESPTATEQKKRRAFGFDVDKKSKTTMHIVEVIVRFCEAVRALNDGISSITHDALTACLLSASNRCA